MDFLGGGDLVVVLQETICLLRVSRLYAVGGYICNLGIVHKNMY